LHVVDDGVAATLRDRLREIHVGVVVTVGGKHRDLHHEHRSADLDHIGVVAVCDQRAGGVCFEARGYLIGLIAQNGVLDFVAL
jgi:hypothetical protein